jgi:hypothetical protein
MKNKNSKNLSANTNIDAASKEKTLIILKRIINDCTLNESLVKNGLWNKYICDMTEQEYESYMMFLQVMKVSLLHKE